MAEVKRKRILIVEDTDTVQLMVKRWVTTAGYEVDLASDGEEALRKVAAEAPDLILLDVMMPGPNGYAVCRKIREMDTTKKTPIIIVTGLKSSRDLDEAKMSGANEVMVKPVNEQELIQRVRYYLGSMFK